MLTLDRLDELVPVEPAAMDNRQVIEWDKDDIDALKFMKVDVLGLGMLGCMRRAFDLLDKAKGERLDLATIPAEDPATYAMIRKADTMGIFQIESRAQMSMLPRLKPKTFYDLVIEVAIVRPGPIQGDMVHPYIRRREGKEDGALPDARARKGARQDARRAAVSGTGHAGRDGRGRLLADRGRPTAPRDGDLQVHRRRPQVSRTSSSPACSTTATRREFAERTFKQLEGFGSYGFPESHAASFALIAYASSWMKCHHPDVFLAAILNAQPMGFYAPAQLVRDAREHGVEVRPVDVNLSEWDCTLEPTGRRTARGAPRLLHGARPRREGRPAHRRRRTRQPTTLSRRIEDLWRRAAVPVATLAAASRGRMASGALACRAVKPPGRSRRCAMRPCRCLPLPTIATGTLRPEAIEPAVTLAAA